MVLQFFHDEHVLLKIGAFFQAQQNDEYHEQMFFEKHLHQDLTKIDPINSFKLF